jgi:transposase
MVLCNLRPGRIGGRDWARWWGSHGEQVPPNLCAEIERESARLALVKEQMKTLEAARRQAIAAGRHPVVAQLAKLRAIGPRGAWILDKEVFGWRRFANRREGAGKRMRRVGVVALARRLAIALWRYLEHREIPAGAVLKPLTA